VRNSRRRSRGNTDRHPSSRHRKSVRRPVPVRRHTATPSDSHIRERRKPRQHGRQVLASDCPSIDGQSGSACPLTGGTNDPGRRPEQIQLPYAGIGAPYRFVFRPQSTIIDRVWLARFWYDLPKGYVFVSVASRQRSVDASVSLRRPLHQGVTLCGASQSFPQTISDQSSQAAPGRLVFWTCSFRKSISSFFTPSAPSVSVNS